MHKLKKVMLCIYYKRKTGAAGVITFRKIGKFQMVIKMVRMVIFYAEKSNHPSALIFSHLLHMVIMVINVYT